MHPRMRSGNLYWMYGPNYNRYLIQRNILKTSKRKIFEISSRKLQVSCSTKEILNKYVYCALTEEF